jgi:hypothetical protein
VLGPSAYVVRTPLLSKTALNVEVRMLVLRAACWFGAATVLIGLLSTRVVTSAWNHSSSRSIGEPSLNLQTNGVPGAIRPSGGVGDTL